MPSKLRYQMHRIILSNHKLQLMDGIVEETGKGYNQYEVYQTLITKLRYRHHVMKFQINK